MSENREAYLFESVREPQIDLNDQVSISTFWSKGP